MCTLPFNKLLFQFENGADTSFHWPDKGKPSCHKVWGTWAIAAKSQTHKKTPRFTIGNSFLYI